QIRRSGVRASLPLPEIVPTLRRAADRHQVRRSNTSRRHLREPLSHALSMAQDDDSRPSKPPTESGGGPLSALAPGRGTDPKALPSTEVAELEQGGDEEIVASELGALRYVHAAFFAAAILAAYLCGQVLLSIWNSLADWPAAVRAVPQLIQYAED